MQLIGLCGYKRSGKDTAANILRRQGYEQLAFATPLKLMLETLLQYANVSPGLVNQCLNGHRKDFALGTLQAKSCRQAMQTLGTEWGRDLIGQDLWVDILFDHAQSYDKVVISDVRFDNEVVALRKHGGKLIRIDRGHSPSGHASEYIEHIIPDITITNIGTLLELEYKITQAEHDFFACPLQNCGTDSPAEN